MHNAQLCPLQTDHLPRNVGGGQAVVDSAYENKHPQPLITTGVYSQQLDYKSEVVGGQVITEELGHAVGHDNAMER